MTDYETQLRDEFAKIAFAAFMNDVDKHAKAASIAEKNGETVYSFWTRHAYIAADTAMQARKATQEPKP